MGLIVSLSFINAAEAENYVADSRACLRIDLHRPQTELWHDDRYIVEIFAGQDEVLRTLYQYGHEILCSDAWDAYDGYRILLFAEVTTFDSLLKSVDDAVIEAKCRRWSAEALASWEELGIFFADDFSTPTSNILDELRQFVQLAVSQHQALLIYWG